MAKTKEEKCATKYCRNRRALKFTYYTSPVTGVRIKYEHWLKHCWKCRARWLKANHPATYVLNMLRHSARKRKLPFTLTVEEFKAFCRNTGYLEKRGNQPEDLTIDRIDWNEGYHLWNLQVMSHEENSEQGCDNTSREERGAVVVAEDNQPF